MLAGKDTNVRPESDVFADVHWRVEVKRAKRRQVCSALDDQVLSLFDSRPIEGEPTVNRYLTIETTAGEPIQERAQLPPVVIRQQPDQQINKREPRMEAPHETARSEA